MPYKEYFNYKDKVILEQHGRWFNLYVDGSLVCKNMSREEGEKTYHMYRKQIIEEREA